MKNNLLNKKPLVSRGNTATQTTFVPGRHPSTQGTIMAPAQNPPVISSPMAPAQNPPAINAQNDPYQLAANPNRTAAMTREMQWRMEQQGVPRHLGEQARFQQALERQQEITRRRAAASTQTPVSAPIQNPPIAETPVASGPFPDIANTPNPESVLDSEFASQLTNEQYEYSADPLNEQQAYNDRLIYGQAQQIEETLQSQYDQAISGIEDEAQVASINNEYTSNLNNQLSDIGYGEVEQRISQHRQQQYGTIQTMVRQLQSLTDKFNGTDNNKGTYKQQMLQRRSPFNGLVNKTIGVSKRT